MTALKIAVVPSVFVSEDASSLIEQQLVFGRPTVWVDTVKDVSCMVVDCAQSTDDSEALVARRLDSVHTLIECAFDERSTRLTQSAVVCSVVSHYFTQYD